MPTASQTSAPLGDGVGKSQGTFWGHIPKIPAGSAALSGVPWVWELRNKIKPNPQKPLQLQGLLSGISSSHRIILEIFQTSPSSPEIQSLLINPPNISISFLNQISLYPPSKDLHLLSKSSPSPSALGRRGRRCREGRAQL